MHYLYSYSLGWTAACDFLGLMINMQVFFSDPESRVHSNVPEAISKSLQYTCPCEDCAHNNDAFLVEMAARLELVTPVSLLTDSLIRVKNELFCSISKCNIVEEPTLILGYPVHVYKDRYGRLQSTLLPELISYDEYMRARQQSLQERTSHSYFSLQ